MRLFGLNRHRSENALLLIGQLVLIAYVFQVAALDHWGAPPINVGAFDVSGLPGSDAHTRLHADHCHGGPATCADGGTGFSYFSPSQLPALPAESASLMLDTDSTVLEPREAVLSPNPEPPRAFI